METNNTDDNKIMKNSTKKKALILGITGQDA
jgi:hypothetical protein